MQIARVATEAVLSSVGYRNRSTPDWPVLGRGALQFGNRFEVPLNQAEFILLDLEMTGINRIDDASIIQIAARKYRQGQPAEEYITLVKPEPNHPIPQNIQELTGITPQMVRNAPAQRVALQGLAQFVGDQPILVGHLIGLDIAFLRKKLDRYGLEGYQNRFELDQSLCTWTLLEKLVPGEPSYRASDLASRLEIPLPETGRFHDAAFDIEVGHRFLRYAFAQAQQADPTLSTVADVYRLQGRPIAWPE